MGKHELTGYKQTDADLQIGETMTRLREIYVKASDPFERGRQHGSQVKEEIAGICEGYRKSFAKLDYSWDEAKEMALEYVPYLEEIMPDLVQEARGIAAGAEIDLGTVMVLNTRYELLKFAKGVDGFRGGNCTCFAVNPEATQDHETIGGQNWDNAPFIGENLYVLHIDEENGTKIAGLCEPAQLIRSGMNSYGISLNCSTLLSTWDKRGITIPTNFMRRRILQCRTFEEACDVVHTLEPCVSLNYVITSKTGQIIAYETNPKEIYPVYPARGVLTQANDLKADPSIDRFRTTGEHTAQRYRGPRMDYLLQKKAGVITAEYIQECLKDHENYPDSICNHFGEGSCETIASVLYCVDRGYALIAWGNPCENAYERYELD